MILRATSDLHVRPENAEYVFRALGQLEADAAQHGGVTFILGDVFDQPDVVHMPTWDRLRLKFQHWPGRLIVIAGNHDQYDRPSNALDGMAGRSCTVHSVPTAGDLGAFIPYTPPGEFAKALARVHLPVGALPFVWCHHGFKGAYRNAMNRDDNGVDCSSVGEKVVITGHYHLAQNLGNVIYTGSPIEHSFSEEGQIKGWLRWTDAKSDPIPHRIAFEDTGAPRHVTIHWSPELVGVSAPVVWDKARDKIRIKTPVEASVAKAHRDQLVKYGLEGVTVLAKPDGASQRGVVRPGASPLEAVKAYLAAIHGLNPNMPAPTELLEWAEEHELLRF